MMLQPRKQTIAIHIFPNISRSKDNHATKYGQLIEYNIKNIFIGKYYKNCGGKTIPRCFSKKLKLRIFLDQKFVFILCQIVGYQNLLKLSCKTFAFISYKAFLKK